jgi:hypothetical protein
VRQAVSAAWLSVVRDRTQRDEDYLLAVGQLAPEAEYPPELASRSDEHHRAAAEAVGSALTSTLHALGVDVRDLRVDQLEGFVRAFSLAVSFLFPEPTRYSSPIGAVMERDQKGAT